MEVWTILYGVGKMAVDILEGVEPVLVLSPGNSMSLRTFP